MFIDDYCSLGTRLSASSLKNKHYEIYYLVNDGWNVDKKPIFSIIMYIFVCLLWDNLNCCGYF